MQRVAARPRPANEIVVRCDRDAPVELPRRAAGVPAHRARAGGIVAERRDGRGQRVGLARRRDGAAVVFARR